MAAAQERETASVEAVASAHVARLASHSRRATAVCAGVAAGDGAAPGSLSEYEKAFDTVLDYVVEAACLGNTGGSSAAAASDDSRRTQHALALTGTAGLAGGGSAAAATCGRAEAAAALDSVMPLSAVARWVTLPPAERVAQLQPLARLTLGICMFNSGPVAAGGGNSGNEAGLLPVAGRASLGIGARLERPSSRGGSRSSAWGGGSSGRSAPGGEAGVQQLLQQGAHIANEAGAMEAVAWAALRAAQAALPGGGRCSGGGGTALFCAQAATVLRALRADARQGLVACGALRVALQEELGAVRSMWLKGTGQRGEKQARAPLSVSWQSLAWELAERAEPYRLDAYP
jgi:hypothetical protein